VTGNRTVLGLRWGALESRRITDLRSGPPRPLSLSPKRRSEPMAAGSEQPQKPAPARATVLLCDRRATAATGRATCRRRLPPLRPVFCTNNPLTPTDGGLRGLGGLLRHSRRAERFVRRTALRGEPPTCLPHRWQRCLHLRERPGTRPHRSPALAAIVISCPIAGSRPWRIVCAGFTRTGSRTIPRSLPACFGGRSDSACRGNERGGYPR
jgi:hypothetical protein